MLGEYRWGLVPWWSKSPSGGSRLFNARAESVPTKPAFRSAFESQRLVIPADGFYEWQKAPSGRRQPYFFQRADGHPMAFAGLWESWRDPKALDDEHRWLRSCTIITTVAGPDMDGIHDRMPLVLDLDLFDTWLDPDADGGALTALLKPTPPGVLVHHRVPARVGNVRNDDPGLIELDAPSAEHQQTLWAAGDG